MASFRAFRHASILIVAWVGVRAYYTTSIDPPASQPIAQSTPPKKPYAADVALIPSGCPAHHERMTGLKSVTLPPPDDREDDGLAKPSVRYRLPDTSFQPSTLVETATANIDDADRESSLVQIGQSTRAPTFGAAKSRNWGGSAYAFVRPSGVGELARGGQLGGSQTALRLIGPAVWGRAHWSLRPSVRGIFTPGRNGGTQADIGLALDRPIGGGRIELAIDRRMTVQGDASDAFALTLAAGGQFDLPSGVQAQGYVQGGAVGLSHRQLFADIGLQMDRKMLGGQPSVRAGIGGWAAAQPGVARIDVGPSARIAVPLAGGDLTIKAEWRIRVAGNARPGSGPAITIGSDF